MSPTGLGMPGGTGRLSVPRHLPAPPAELTPAQHEVLAAVGDLLIPAVGEDPSFTQAPGIQDRLRTAIAARGEQFDLLAATLDGLGPADGGLDGRLRALHAAGSDQDDRFVLLSSVVAGAYLLVPEVRQRIGYPGQGRDPAGIEEAADELSDGILDPVIERGPVWVAPDALVTAPATEG
jgi:hypothetical protein